MDREYDIEEYFHGKDRKQSKKERKYAQMSDRSKFKKTDRGKKGIPPIDPRLKRGRVISISKEGVWLVSEGKKILASIKGLLKKEIKETKNIVAVGDFVRFNSDYAISHIDERYSFLARTDVSGKKEQLIAVNIDQVLIVVSLINPPLKPALIDRYLIAAEKGNIFPIIIVNKTDLLQTATPKELERYEEFIAVYEKLGLTLLSTSTKELIGIDSLKGLLKNKSTVFSGQSGVGKSSILNACYGMDLKIGKLATKYAKGSHTTTTAEFIPLPGGGYCVDTPGIRSFALWKLQKEDVTGHFKDLVGLGCKYSDCSHINEPECMVLKALEDGVLSPLRYESYRSLYEEATGGADNRTRRKESDE